MYLIFLPYILSRNSGHAQWREFLLAALPFGGEELWDTSDHFGVLDELAKLPNQYSSTGPVFFNLCRLILLVIAQIFRILVIVLDELLKGLRPSA